MDPGTEDNRIVVQDKSMFITASEQFYDAETSSFYASNQGSFYVGRILTTGAGHMFTPHILVQADGQS